MSDSRQPFYRQISSFQVPDTTRIRLDFEHARGRLLLGVAIGRRLIPPLHWGQLCLTTQVGRASINKSSVSIDYTDSIEYHGALRVEDDVLRAWIVPQIIKRQSGHPCRVERNSRKPGIKIVLFVRERELCPTVPQGIDMRVEEHVGRRRPDPEWLHRQEDRLKERVRGREKIQCLTPGGHRM